MTEDAKLRYDVTGAIQRLIERKVDSVQTVVAPSKKTDYSVFDFSYDRENEILMVNQRRYFEEPRSGDIIMTFIVKDYTAFFFVDLICNIIKGYTDGEIW